MCVHKFYHFPSKILDEFPTKVLNSGHKTINYGKQKQKQKTNMCESEILYLSMLKTQLLLFFHVKDSFSISGSARTLLLLLNLPIYQKPRPYFPNDGHLKYLIPNISKTINCTQNLQNKRQE